MLKKMSWLLILLVVFGTGQAFAFSNGEVKPEVLSIAYNVNLLDDIRGIIIESEYGLTSTLAVDGIYVYSAAEDFIKLNLKFKLYDNPDLKIAGRVGVGTDFVKNTPIYKTLGFVFTKAQNSFITLNGGCDYSMDDGAIGFFGGFDYQLSSRAFVQGGYQKFVGQNHTQGFVIGLRTDL